MTEVNIELWKRANKVYAQLMDLTVSDALAQLSQMDSLDDELKSLVLTLISSGNQPSQYFKQHISANFQLDDGFENNIKVGDEVGGYELLEELGVGGMAKVYKAQRLDADSQKSVAIKLFNRQGASSILANRFAIEQDILAGLTHPNIVNMHHGGTSEQGIPYIVMELIDHAADIDQYAQAHKASTKQKIKWIIAAARAIAYAHNNLIVHRDIKPSNILIDDSGQLKVVDFGIAKLISKDDAPQKTTIMALTPSFAAPEQINSGKISVSTDVFSLAAVSLALLIEDLPLPADRLLKSCAEDEAHIWQTLRSQIQDKDLRNILNQALQQDPNKRYRNMDLFADDLSAWMADKPVMASPDSWMYRIKKFAQRRSALFAALASLVTMILLGIVLLGWQVEKTQAEAAKAREVKDFMLGVFSVVNPDEALGEKILAKDLLSQASAEIKAKDFKDASTKVELLTAMGQAQLQLGLNQQASASFNDALSIDGQAISASLGSMKTVMARGDLNEVKARLLVLDKLIPADHAAAAEMMLLKSSYAGQTGDYDEAGKLAKEAQKMFEQQDNFKGYLESARQLSNIMYLKSESKAGAEFLEQQLALGLNKLAPTNTVILAMQNDLVELYNDIGEYSKAITHSAQLIDNIRTVLGDKHPFLVQAYISRAGTNRSVGQIDAAKADAKFALELSTELNGEAHETTARAMNLMAVLSYVTGEIELALEQMKQASVMFDQVLGSEHPESWDVKTNLTALLNMVQRYDEAIEIIEPVYFKQSDVLGASHKSTIYSQTILARLYGDVGRLVEAQIMAEDMLNRALSELGLDHPLTVGGHFTLAKIYQKQSEFPAAIDLLQTVVNSEGWSDKNERTITAYNTLADLYLDNEEFLKAAEFKEKSVQVAIDLLTEQSPRTIGQMLKNAEFYISMNNPEKAESYIERIALLLGGLDEPNDKLMNQLQSLTTELTKIKP